MRSFLDTTVLIAAFYGDHQHHARSAQLFGQQKRSTGCTAAHCLAEVYSVATGMPGKNRANPDEIMLFLRDAQERLSQIALEQKDYTELLDSAAVTGIAGGAIYDALIAHCALKANAQAIFTWNVRHFARLGPTIATRLREP